VLSIFKLRVEIGGNSSVSAAVDTWAVGIQWSGMLKYAMRECGVAVMVTKSVLMMVLATLAGPAIGIGLFVLLQSM